MKNSKIVSRLLKEASDKFSTHGCTDFQVKNNAKNRQLILDIAEWDSGIESDDYLYALKEFHRYSSNSEKYIIFNDWVLMRYFADKVKDKK